MQPRTKICKTFFSRAITQKIVQDFTINFGPQHPTAHGVLRLVLEICKSCQNCVDHGLSQDCHTFQHLAQGQRQVDSHAPAHCRDAASHSRQHAIHHAVRSLRHSRHTASQEPAPCKHIFFSQKETQVSTPQGSKDIGITLRANLMQTPGLAICLLTSSVLQV